MSKAGFEDELSSYDETTRETAERMSDLINKNPHELKLLKKFIDVDALKPYLIKYGLVLLDQLKLFDIHTTTRMDRIELLSSMIRSSGSTASYCRFIQCLREDSGPDSNPPHHQYLKHLYLDAYLLDGLLISRKRGRDDDDGDDDDEDDDDEDIIERDSVNASNNTVSVSKRQLLSIKPDGKLARPKYITRMAEIQKHHVCSEWKEADMLVEECKSLGEEFYYAAKLRSYSCHVTTSHISKDVITKNVQEILKICSRRYQNNYKILESKCHWVLAKSARYAKKMDEAEKHLTAAMEFHHAFEPGEDIGCSSYCKASILNHALSQKFSKELFAEVRKLYRKAIDNVSLNEFSYGLPICQPMIRLVQMCLFCTPHEAGTCNDKELLKEAKELINEIENRRMVLKPRISCLYYVAKSDWHRNSHEHTKAEDYARRAELIAHEGNFTAEINTVNTRLKALGLEECSLGHN